MELKNRVMVMFMKVTFHKIKDTEKGYSNGTAVPITWAFGG